ncbi:MAG: START domain-containing protein [Sphingobacteriales bacterium]|nr:MAG: START domain-containing protein [Sphingobacteriales bacterium]
MNPSVSFRSLVLLLIVSSFALAFTVLPQNDWEIAKEQNGIKVFTRKNSGEMKEYRGETTISASVNDVFTLLSNFENYASWMPSCIENKVLKRISDTELYQYNVTDAPWPVNDRDSVIKTKITKQTTGVILIELAAAPDYIPAKSGRVRVPSFKGYWKLTPKDAKSTQIVYEGKPSAGGSIPAWLANSSVIDVPFNTLAKMKSLLNGKN